MEWWEDSDTSKGAELRKKIEDGCVFFPPRWEEEESGVIPHHIEVTGSPLLHKDKCVCKGTLYSYTQLS